VRVCLVKQAGCYDLYTVTGGDAAALARSSACRSGPLGLWEWPGFTTDFRVLTDCGTEECRRGPREWAPFVAGKTFRAFTGVADDPWEVAWSEYDIVISVDVAVPEAVVRSHPAVLWCHYFIEGGPWGVKEQWADSPQYGYDVFLNHRPAAAALTSRSRAVRRLRRARRTVLDFPYYLLSDRTIADIYPAAEGRSGVCLASSSRDHLSEALRTALQRFGPLRLDYASPSELHQAMAASRYFVVTPGSPAKTGGALVDAVSAGCVVLAPSETVREFGQIVAPWLDCSGDAGLLGHLDALEGDAPRYDLARGGQAAIVRRTFWEYPLRNLQLLAETFAGVKAPVAAQHRSERLSRALAPLHRLPRRVRRRLTAPRA
jgi:hypothetical protein